jgi:hypothetical protein
VTAQALERLGLDLARSLARESDALTDAGQVQRRVAVEAEAPLDDATLPRVEQAQAPPELLAELGAVDLAHRIGRVSYTCDGTRTAREWIWMARINPCSIHHTP